MKTISKFFFGLCFILLTLRSVCFAVPPQAVDDQRAIGVSSQLIINVLANDFDQDGDSFTVVAVSEPSFGSAQVNSDGSIIYIPEADFTGTDQFTYTIQENSESGDTAVASVVIEVLENVYLSLLTSNNTASVASAFASYCNSLRSEQDADLDLIQVRTELLCSGLEFLAQANPELASFALAQISPEETLSIFRNALDSARSQTNTVSQRLTVLRTGSQGITFNGLSLFDKSVANTPKNKEYLGAAGDSSPWSALGLFISLQTGGLDREESDNENGFSSQNGSATLGIDYRLSANMIIGAALGINQSNMDYLNNSGSVDTQTNTVILFSALNYGPFSLEAQTGYSEMKVDSLRNIRYADLQNSIDFNSSSRTFGRQQLLNLQAQWQWHRGGLSLYPFLRVDGVSSNIDEYEESGGQGFSVGLRDQSAMQVTFSGGLQSTYAMSYSWGIFLPTFELSALNEIDVDRDPVTGFFVFDQQNDNEFILEADDGDSDFYQWSAGASLVMKHGASAFFQYRHTFGYEHYSAWQLQAGLRFEL